MDLLENLRSVKFFEYAIFDLIVSFLGMYLASNRLSKIFLKIKIDIPRINFVFLTLPISIFVHIIFNNITPLTRNFLDINDHYFLKILVLTLLFLGLRDIKKVTT